MESFTVTGKLKTFFFLQLEMFDVCTTGETAYIDTIFKFMQHTRQHGCIDILHCYNDTCLKARIIVTLVHTSNISSCQKTTFQVSFGCEQLL
jgi:hypothetical protein